MQVGSREYSFSDHGVIFHEPRNAGADAIFKEAILLGEVESMAGVNGAVASLRTKFAPGTYNLVKQNCNHFTDELAKALVGKSIPSWVNRSARLGSSFAPKDVNKEDGPKKKKKENKKAPLKERPQLTEKQKAMLDKLKQGSGDQKEKEKEQS